LSSVWWPIERGRESGTFRTFESVIEIGVENIFADDEDDDEDDEF
jgi:hypothetical protein